MSSPAANRRKGAAFEIALMKELRERGLDAERLRLAGRDDEGDLVIRYAEAGRTAAYKVIEAKSGAMHPAAFVREMETERANFARARGLPLNLVDGLVVAKAPRQPVLKSYVLTTLDRYLNLED
jgi:Holliday junction resolvase